MFVDLGKINDAAPRWAPREWLFDVGAQVKLKMLGSGLIFSMAQRAGIAHGRQ